MVIFDPMALITNHIFQILEWCMKFKSTPHQMMNGSAY